MQLIKNFFYIIFITKTTEIVSSKMPKKQMEVFECADQFLYIILYPHGRRHNFAKMLAVLEVWQSGRGLLVFEHFFLFSRMFAEKWLRLGWSRFIAADFKRIRTEYFWACEGWVRYSSVQLECRNCFRKQFCSTSLLVDWWNLWKGIH